MKIKYLAILTACCFFYNFPACAQSWSLKGNSLSGNPVLGSTNGHSLDFITFGLTRMTISPDGNVGIGTGSTTGFRLSVDGKLRAREVFINLEDWADDVFDPGYPLMPFDVLEEFIRQHRHLPQVPPAVRMTGTAVSIGTVQTLLMRKIEELTLYVIDMNQRITALEDRLCTPALSGHE